LPWFNGFTGLFEFATTTRPRSTIEEILVSPVTKAPVLTKRLPEPRNSAERERHGSESMESSLRADVSSYLSAQGTEALQVHRLAHLARPVSTLARKSRLFLEWNWAMFFPPDISHFGYRRSQRRPAFRSISGPTTHSHSQTRGFVK
jgi:hypothetical protein